MLTILERGGKLRIQGPMSLLKKHKTPVFIELIPTKKSSFEIIPPEFNQAPGKKCKHNNIAPEETPNLTE